MQERDIHYAVERLLTRYVRCLDEDRLEDWPDFFADEDCFYQVNSAANVSRGMPMGIIYADSKGMLLDRVTALREANIYEAQRYRHLVSSIEILDATDLSAVKAEANYIVVRIMQDGSSMIFSVGRYEDVIDLSSEPHRFREKRVIFDNERVDTLLAIPI